MARLEARTRGAREPLFAQLFPPRSRSRRARQMHFRRPKRALTFSAFGRIASPLRRPRPPYPRAVLFSPLYIAAAIWTCCSAEHAIFPVPTAEKNHSMSLVFRICPSRSRPSSSSGASRPALFRLAPVVQLTSCARYWPVQPWPHADWLSAISVPVHPNALHASRHATLPTAGSHHPPTLSLQRIVITKTYVSAADANGQTPRRGSPVQAVEGDAATVGSRDSTACGEGRLTHAPKLGRAAAPEETWESLFQCKSFFEACFRFRPMPIRSAPRSTGCI